MRNLSQGTTAESTRLRYSPGTNSVGRSRYWQALIAPIVFTIFALGPSVDLSADEIAPSAAVAVAEAVSEGMADRLPIEASLEQLSWLAGSWQGSRDDITYEEVWMAPKGTMMPGVHRDVRTDGRTAFEFLRIANSEEGLVYYASPSGRAPTEFPLVELSAGPSEFKAVFENLENDFPQRLIYRREGEVLHVRIDSRQADGTVIHAIEWQWHLVTD